MTPPTIQTPAILLTPRDAARALAISEPTLRRLVRRGAIVPKRFPGGRVVRFSVDELRRFADGRERAASESPPPTTK